MRVRVGMSGFAFPSWRGDFYPRRGDMLAHYASHFPTVELNTTFYRAPRPSTVLGWRSAVPETFRFAVKAVRWMSYPLEPKPDWMTSFVDTVRALDVTLGPILIQPPARARYDEARLLALLEALPAGATYAFEPRHPSFHEARGLLERFGVAWCSNDDEEDLTAHEPTGRLAYLRFRRPAYDDGELRSRAEVVRALGREVYVFFRHQESPECVHRALRFAELVGEP